jgi:uncharacterized protein YbjQ (UPF0145 family)
MQERLKCPSCNCYLSSKRTYEHNDEKLVGCNKCGVQSPLGNWRSVDTETPSATAAKASHESNRIIEGEIPSAVTTSGPNTVEDLVTLYSTQNPIAEVAASGDMAIDFDASFALGNEQTKALTNQARTGDVYAIEKLLNAAFLGTDTFCAVRNRDGLMEATLGGRGLQVHKTAQCSYVVKTIQAIFPGGTRFTTIKLETGETIKPAPSPADTCFCCRKTFGFAGNDAPRNGLADCFGICINCSANERNWECRQCNFIVRTKKGFRVPKCPRCKQKLILDKNQLIQQLLAPDAPPKLPTSVISKEAAFNRDHSLRENRDKIESIILTTSNSVEGYSIVGYRGIVVGSAIAQGRMPTDDLSSTSLTGLAWESLIDDALAQTMQKFLADATDKAQMSLKVAAFEAGADAVIGIDIDYVGSKIMQVYMNGTAVKLEAMQLREDIISGQGNIDFAIDAG